MPYLLSRISVATILQEFYQTQQADIVALVRAHLPQDSTEYRAGVKILWNAFTALNIEDDNTEKMQLLTSCLEESHPIIVPLDVDAYDFAISVINTQLPMWRKLSSFTTMTKEDIADGKMRLLESPGILNLENDACLVYPNYEGNSAAFLEEKDRRNKPKDITEFVFKGTFLRESPEVTLSKIASFFFLFVNTIHERINAFYGENLPETLDELREVFSLIASQYTVPLCAIPHDAILEIQATNHFFTGISNKLVEAEAEENPVNMMEDFFSHMQDNLSALACGTLDQEKENGGFFSGSPDSIMSTYFPDLPSIIKKFKVRNGAHKIPDECFQISNKNTDEQILIQFYRLNKEFLTEIDENNFSEKLYQYTLHRLWSKYVSDSRCPLFIKNKPELKNKIDTIAESLCEIIFDSHLIEVIEKGDVTDVNMRFAKAVEAVAIMWTYPTGVGEYNSNILDFKAAVQNMRTHPDHITAIHQLYEENVEGKLWKKEHRSNRPAMLRKITLEFLRIINDPRLLGRLFNKGSIKKIEALAISGDIVDLIESLLTVMRDKNKARQLEKVFLGFVKTILGAITKDFKAIFPESLVFQAFTSQFTAFYEPGGSTVRKIMTGLIVFEIFGLDSRYMDKKRPAGGLDYWLVASLTNDAISRFLLIFSNKNYKKEPDFYEGLTRCINEMFVGDCSSIKYGEVFSGLSDEFTTFIDNMFTKLWSSLYSDPLCFKEILLLQKSMNPDTFVPAIRDYLLEKAVAKNKDQLDVLIDQITEHDPEFFLQVIESALLECYDYKSVDFLIACALRVRRVIDIFAELLMQAAKNNNKPWLLALTQTLPTKEEISSDSNVSTSLPLENDDRLISPFGFSSANFTDNDVYELTLSEILAKIKHSVKESFYAIFNSALSLDYRFGLIGAIAKGKTQRLAYIDPELNKIYKKLALLYNIYNNDFKTQFSSMEDKLTQNKDEEYSCEEQVDTLEVINSGQAEIIRKLTSFDTLLEIFHKNFVLSLGDEEPAQNFHFSIATPMMTMRDNGLGVLKALMLRHFYLMFFPNDSELNKSNLNAQSSFFFPLEDDETQDALTALRSHLENFSRDNIEDYINGITQCLGAPKLAELHENLKFALSVCAWMTALKFRSEFTAEKIAEIHSKIKHLLDQGGVLSTSLFADMHSIWDKYLYIYPLSAYLADDDISEKLWLLKEIWENRSNAFNHKIARVAILKSFVMQFEKKTSTAKTKLDLCEFVFSSAEDALALSSVLSPELSEVGNIFRQLKKYLIRVQGLAVIQEYDALIPCLMERLFSEFNAASYRYFNSMSMTSERHMQNLWNDCILTIKAIAAVNNNPNGVRYSSFARVWEGIEQRVFSTESVNLYNLVSAYDSCLKLEEAGFNMNSSINIIRNQWKGTTGYNVHAKDIKALCFIFELLEANVHSGKLSVEAFENFNTFFKSAVKKMERSGNVLYLTVSNDYPRLVSSWKKTGSLEQITQDLERLYETYAEEDERHPLNFPVVFSYENKTVLRCVEVYWNNQIIERKDCLKSESYLMARVRQGRSTTNMFFNLVLQLLQNSMQVIASTHMSSIPISFALLKSASDIYDDPRVLNECNRDELVGLFVLGLIYQEIAQQVQHEQSMQSRSSVAVHWLCNLPQFFADYNSINLQNNRKNIRALASVGIVKSTVLNYGSREENDPIKNNLRELDQRLPQCKKNEVDYVTWFKKDYLTWFNSRHTQRELSDSRISCSSSK